MSQTLTLTTQQLPEQVGTLSAGDRVLLSGTIYTARDAAHKRLFQLLDEGRPLPFHLQGAVIYYAGPTRDSREWRWAPAAQRLLGGWTVSHPAFWIWG